MLTPMATTDFMSADTEPTRARTMAIVLAAGKGTRMKSAKPKVLHELCGAPMLHHVVRAVASAGIRDLVVVVGHGAADVRASLEKAFGGEGSGVRVRAVEQERQLG